MTPGAFEPLVDESTFTEAQRILGNRTINKSNEELLQSLRALLAKEGRLTLNLIKNSPDTPSPTTYRLRFGGLRTAYKLIGYGLPDQFSSLSVRARTQALREEIVNQLITTFPGEMSIVRKGGRWRTRLRMKNGRIATVLIVRSVAKDGAPSKWQIDPVPHEMQHITLLALLKRNNAAVLDMYVFPNMDRRTRFEIRADDLWLNRGTRLHSLLQFYQVSNAITKRNA
jgi:hypothetical protein